MAIEFSCECGKTIVASDRSAGNHGPCPDCGKILIVPSPGENDNLQNDNIALSDVEILTKVVRLVRKGGSKKMSKAAELLKMSNAPKKNENVGNILNLALFPNPTLQEMLVKVLESQLDWACIQEGVKNPLKSRW